MASEEFDVVVVGGGLVGASLVHALAGSWLRVAWVDRQPLDRLQRDPRSTALAYASHRLLSELGLWSDLASSASAITSVHVSQQHHFGSVTLHADDMAVPALGYVIGNHALGSALAARIAEQPQLSIYTPETVESAAELGTRQAVHLASGQRLSAKLVVAADGVQSTLRDASGIGLRRQVSFAQHAVVAEIEGGGWQPGRAWERFCNYGPLALLPLGADRLSLVYTVPDDQLDRVLALGDDDFLAEIQARAGFVGAFESVSKRAAFPLVAVEAEASWRGRVVLLGNAVRTLHPVAGQGFNLALRDALTLAELLNGLPVGDDPAADAVASRYRQLRRLD
ncbi:MAG: FAD-dependent monooxygenase, partial [Pseudomonadota bacterium]